MKENKREYLQTLRREIWKFSNKYRIYLDNEFDPMRWLRSYKVEGIKLVWPFSEGGVYEMWYGIDRGVCKSFDFWFRITSVSDRDVVHSLRMKLSKSLINFYPFVYEHSCNDTFSTGTSYGFNLHCKHLYAALCEVDKIRNNCRISEIALSSFIPNKELLTEFSYIERERTISPKEKLEKTFSLIEQTLHLNELALLATLNKRISYLKKS